jgi:hypothetical protein
MSLETRISKIELLTAKEDSEFCAESCRKYPETIATHLRDGLACAEPEWFGKGYGVKAVEIPVLEFCDMCGKPTRQQIIEINWTSDTREKII